MPLRPYKRRSAEPDIVHDFVRQLTDNRITSDLLEGARILRVDFDGSATETTINHSLGRLWTGASLVKATSASGVPIPLDPGTADVDGTKQITFQQASSVEMSAWFLIF